MTRTLSLCLIVKDEDADALHEWVDYHTRIGVEGFIIYDNDSAVPVRSTLAEEIAAGGVIVHEITGPYMQDMAYAHCLHFYGETSLWIGFIDADEFLYPKTKDDLRVFLKDYEEAGGLAVNWVLFGSSGYAQKPPGLQIAHFTKHCVLPPGKPGLVKSIIQPGRVINVQTPHSFHYLPGSGCIGENHDLVDGAFRNASTEKIQLNHYVLRSRKQFEQKLRRGRGDHGKSAYHRRAYFDEIDSTCLLDDGGIFSLYCRAQIESQQKRPLFKQERFVPPPDYFRPEQMDFLRFARAAWEAQERGDEATLERIRRIAAEKYPDMDDGRAAPADLDLQVERGQAALLGGRVRDAGEAFEEALRLSPWYLPAWDGMLRVFEKIEGGTTR